MDLHVARRMWLVTEPLHAVTYFAPESFAAWEAVGLPGFWRGYFATRAAPMGAVGADVVIATFFNFAPEMVRRAVPGVWTLVDPTTALEARASGAAAALRSILGDAADPVVLGEAAATLRHALAACAPAGRALFAANAALTWPEDPVEALWHGVTCLREHRGDGHSAALVRESIDGCEAHVLASARSAGDAGRTTRQGARGWSDEAWDAAVARLSERGLVDAAGGVTDLGASLHDEIERATDASALAPWASLGDGGVRDLERLLRPLAERVVTSGVVRFPNPMGLPALTPK